MLKVHNLTRAYGGLKAVDDLSFTVNDKEIVGLIGPNGAGKTTAFNLITGFTDSDSGRVVFKGEEINGLKPYQIIQKRIGRTFQGTRIYKKLNVWQNMFIARHSRVKASSWSAIFGSGRIRKEAEETEQLMRTLLNKVGLADVDLYATASDLPFASQSLLGMAMALSSDPLMIFLDEPLSGMTSAEVAEVGKLIRRFRDEEGITILLIEHNMKAVMELCDRVVVMDYGRSIAQGVPEEIQKNRAVIEAYLGAEM